MLSTHVLSEIKSHCDRVAIMKEGRLQCVDEVANLTKSNAKRIRMVKDGKQEEFIFDGNMNQLLRELAEHDISDILIEEPSLEEIFMHFYTTEK